jgi:uncharacterized protein (DUF1330 family)
MVTVLAFVSIAEDAPEALGAYFKVTGPLLRQAGAKIINRFAIKDAIIGVRPAQTVVIVDYPSREAVDMVFGSPEYAALADVKKRAFHDYAITIVDDTSDIQIAEHAGP